MFQSFLQWKQGEAKKLAALSPEKRLAYIWDYYKLWILGIGAALLLLVSGLWLYFTNDKETRCFVLFANTTADLGDGSELHRDFAAWAAYDRETLRFADQCFCDPTRKLYGNQYYQMLIAYMDSGTMDLLVMDPDGLSAIGASGRLMDLRDPRLSGILEGFSDRVIRVIPSESENGSDPVPVGIDLAGSRLVGPGKPYPFGAVLGVNALAAHPDQALIFLNFLFDNQAP